MIRRLISTGMADMTREKCIFCAIIADEVAHYRVASSDLLYAFLDAYPISRGHTLVVPREHFSSLETTPEMIIKEMAIFVAQYAPKITRALDADGFNIGINNGRAAGQAVDHAHWHIIPRYEGDGLKSWPNTSTNAEKLSRVAEEIRRKI